MENKSESDFYVCSIKMHEQRKTKQKNDDKTPEGAVPAYLLDREGQSRAKVLSNMIKQKRKEKAVSAAQLLVLSQTYENGFLERVCVCVCDVSCRVNGRCRCRRCALREKQKC